MVGHSRSGTNWVYDTLTAHPEVAGVLESWLFTRSIGLSRLFDASHWAADHQRRIAEGQLLGLAQLVTREELAAEVRMLAGRLLARKLEPQHRFLVEKTPIPYLNMDVVAEVFPKARFVHIVRDGRDMAVSLRAAARSWNPGWSQFAPSSGLKGYRALHRSARSWEVTVRRARRIGEGLGRRYLEIRYEDMKGRREMVAQQLFDFCGIPCEHGLLQTILEATDFDRRFQGHEASPRRGGRVGDWRERFGLLDALVFELGSKGALKETGYERHRLWWLNSGLPLQGGWPSPMQKWQGDEERHKHDARP